MGASTTLMAASSASQGISSIGNAYSQSQAIRAQSRHQRDMLETNQRIAEMQADDAIKRGDKEAAKIGQQVKQTVGSQRAALAAQGIDVDVGSAADIQESTRALGVQDMQTVRMNAWKEAWGLKVEALSLQGQASMVKAAGDFEAKNTLLTGGMRALNFGVQSYAYANQGGGKTAKSNPASSLTYNYSSNSGGYA